jgi:glycosyltransferase involved in cell wall biosynthesis
MKTKVAIDVSGLAWRYRTGVQNLYWAYANAWAENPAFHNDFEVLFYDRSGIYNHKLKSIVGSAYQSLAPTWWPDQLRRPLQVLIKSGAWRPPQLSGAINHVWNWNIYDTGKDRCSITVPDILPLEYPQWFDERFLRLTKESLNFAKTRAHYVFAISEYVKQRLMDTTGMSADRIRVVYPGIDPQYFEQPDELSAQGVLRRHGLQEGRFLISSGFLDPRKNLARQIQAFALATRHENSDVKYALTGLKTSLSQDVLTLIDTPEIRTKVVLLGYVLQPDLRALMGKSAALMYCSIAEGFGLPIIEAMATGAPVITSSTTSMQELANGRAITVDPLNVEEMANAITSVLGSRRDEYISRAIDNRKYAATFTIGNWLEGHLKVYNDDK